MYYLFVYRCTCPPKLYLSDDDRTCREALDGKSAFIVYILSTLFVYIITFFCLHFNCCLFTFSSVFFTFILGASTSTSTESSIVVNLLPTDCLWSEWSDWSVFLFSFVPTYLRPCFWQISKFMKILWPLFTWKILKSPGKKKSWNQTNPFFSWNCIFGS